MNERIKELVKQANEAFYQRMGKGAVSGTFYFDGFAEKFAELIVRECAGLNFKSTGQVTTDGEIAISDLILNHFEVDKVRSAIAAVEGEKKS